MTSFFGTGPYYENLTYESVQFCTKYPGIFHHISDTTLGHRRPALSTARWLPIGRGGWAKDWIRAQQLSARGGTMQCAIAGRARLYLHGTLEL